ncbi:SPY, partial [Symbiodinium microadriaticum]
ILLRDPQAVVLLSSSVNSKFLSQELFQSRLGRYLATMGADSFRVVLIPQGPSIMYNKILCASDVSIDTFPFGGGVTLSDALRCAVPFVTSGELQGVHRIGEGIARQIALEDVLVAENEVDFVTKALFLANSTLSCRKRHFWSAGLHEAYSTCEFPLLPSPADNTDICDLRSRLCAGKRDSGLFPEERSLGEHHTAVTAEWEEFLRRVHYVQSVRS